MVVLVVSNCAGSQRLQWLCWLCWLSVVAMVVLVVGGCNGCAVVVSGCAGSQ